jgi:hypothetical protein
MGINRNLVELLSTGISLHSIGIYNWALEKEQVLAALAKMKSLNIPVLGGDVYMYKDDRLVPTYANWFCDQLGEETNKDYVLRSIDTAKVYIKKIDLNGVVPYFVLVPGDSIVETDDYLDELRNTWINKRGLQNK